MSKQILTRAQRRAVREHGSSRATVSKTDARKLRRHGMVDTDGRLTPAGLVVRQLLTQLHTVNTDLSNAEDEIDDLEAGR